jgi:hypothetical protein
MIEMATDPVEPLEEIQRIQVDLEVEDEMRRVLAEPRVKARLDAFEGRERRGELHGISHNEARRIVGLPPLPEHE